jgi:hypothetical protein
MFNCTSVRTFSLPHATLSHNILNLPPPMPPDLTLSPRHLIPHIELQNHLTHNSPQSPLTPPHLPHHLLPPPHNPPAPPRRQHQANNPPRSHLRVFNAVQGFRERRASDRDGDLPLYNHLLESRMDGLGRLRAERSWIPRSLPPSQSLHPQKQ